MIRQRWARYIESVKEDNAKNINLRDDEWTQESPWRTIIRGCGLEPLIYHRDRVRDYAVRSLAFIPLYAIYLYIKDIWIYDGSDTESMIALMPSSLHVNQQMWSVEHMPQPLASMAIVFLLIILMMIVLKITDTRARGQNFKPPLDFRGSIIIIFQSWGIFGALALISWCQFLMLPNGEIEKHYIGEFTARYMVNWELPIYIFSMLLLQAVFIGYMCMNIAASLHIPGWVAVPAIGLCCSQWYNGYPPNMQVLGVIWVWCIIIISWLVRSGWGSVLGVATYVLMLSTIADRSAPSFPWWALVQFILFCLAACMVMLVAWGGLYRIYWLESNRGMLDYLKSKGLYTGEF